LDLYIIYVIMFDRLHEIKTLMCQPSDEEIVDTAIQEEGHTIIHKTLLGKMLHYIVVMFHGGEA